MKGGRVKGNGERPKVVRIGPAWKRKLAKKARPR
jgi:hypothetical protein